MIKPAAFAILAILIFGLTSAEKSAITEPPLWLRYPAVSPDGQTIVFCYKGDIYKVPVNGGIATPITISDAHDFMPVWSPDGKSIAFASDRNGNFDVYTVSIDGGAAQRLTFHSSSDYPQCFSTDGQTVQFTSARMDNATFTQFPYGALSELYSVPVAGGRETQLLSIAAEDVKWNKAGTQMLFHDRKGYEDPWRKHHTSSVARDLWLYDKPANSFKKLTDFAGEDRNAVWSSDEQTVYYLSEQSGSYNVWKMKPDGSAKEQLTKFDKNPVRFLSVAQNSTLCFGYNGEIYIKTADGDAKKVAITIQTDERYAGEKTESFSDGATEVAVSPNGKEMAFIVRGEVFVTSAEGGTTKRITQTPGQERNVSFSPDGRSILYASERDQIWGIYRTNLVRKEESYFFHATLLAEETLVKGTTEAFQPAYSPDGTEIAYLEDRTAVKVYNIASKKSREILPANRNYSYSDGDQSFDWSPDGKYLIVNVLQQGNWRENLALADAAGGKPLIMLTESGFGANGGKFMMNGKMMLFYSSRNGMKNVASHGNQSDAYGLFFTQEAYDRFKMKKEEYLLLKEKEENQPTGKAGEKPKSSDKEKGDTLKKKPDPLKIETEGLQDRRTRLTIHSSNLADALISPDGEKLYYFCRFEGGIDLWVTKFKENETKLLLKLNAGGISSVAFDKDASNIICIIDGKIARINLDKAEKKDISFQAEMTIDAYKERAELFEHMWRQVVKKFYVTDLQKTDWKYYKENYARFLPHINNNRDFAEMSSELLGELNASHTGCRYNARYKNPDETANLGVFFDETHTGDGLKITEVIAKGPLVKNGSQIKAGAIIEKIDGTAIKAGMNYFPLLNRKAGKNVLLSVYDPTTKKRWDEIVVPLAPGQVQSLLYQRWVKRMQDMTDKLSNGEIAYMHVQGMNDDSYREFYDQVMGKYVNKKGLIVDTRFNGGGWLHDDLVTFLSGKQYIHYIPREQEIGVEPANKWIRSSVVLMGEGNYSDAHMFPVIYKTLGIGKLIGMPVPGTGTAVWWETLQDPTLVFGIPQVGVVTMDGKYYENNQLEPDIKVVNEYNAMLQGEDQQLKKAVETLLGN